MEFKKLQTPSLKDIFVNEIETMIISGKLKIGEKLPSERELAEKMNVSRTVINNGILQLAQKGFLRVEARSGVYVMDYRRYGSIETLVSLMNYHDGQLQDEEVDSILELKVVLDRLALTKVIESYQKKDIIVLEGLLNTFIEEEDKENCAELIFSFYHELAIISKNTLLPLIYSSFKILVTNLWQNYIEKYGKQFIYNKAYNILEAIKTKDLQTALNYAQQTIDTSMLEPIEIHK